MGDETMKGVRDVFSELQMKGYRNIEIFDESVLTGDWLIRYREASMEMELLTEGWTKWLDNTEISKTKMYQLNREWAQMLKNEGYEVFDMGDIPLKEGNYKGFSPFYAIEKLIIFGN